MSKEKEIVLTKTEQRVFDYINENGSITSLDAINELGETRLSARIFDLIHKGIPITCEWMKVSNRYGESRRIKAYRIA